MADCIIKGEICTEMQNKKRKYGGNGSVRFMENKSHTSCYAVKYFKFDNNCKIEKDRLLERYKRFAKEINFLNNNQNSLFGIVPIVDAHIPDEYNASDPAYYAMPICENINIESYTITNALNECLVLAKALKQIHDLGFAHRDIKPDNILYYNNQPCFCDFGLIWEENGERITFGGERIGPIRTLPPELRSVDPVLDNDINFRYSDVYLLAKLLWEMLSRDKDGFWGEYDRNNNQIYLPFFEEEKVTCFEPIHKLMEEATRDFWKDRIDIDKFISLLSLQIGILNGNITNNINRFNFETRTKRLYHSNEEISKQYKKPELIVKYFSDISSTTKIRISQNDNSIIANVEKSYLNGDLVVLRLNSALKIFDLYINPDCLTISNDYAVKMKAKRIEMLTNDLYLLNLSILDIKEQKYYIDDKYEIEVIINEP